MIVMLSPKPFFHKLCIRVNTSLFNPIHLISVESNCKVQTILPLGEPHVMDFIPSHASLMLCSPIFILNIYIHSPSEILEKFKPYTELYFISPPIQPSIQKCPRESINILFFHTMQSRTTSSVLKYTRSGMY